MLDLSTRSPQQNAPRIPAVRQAALNAQIRAQPELQSPSHTPQDAYTRRTHGAAPPHSRTHTAPNGRTLHPHSPQRARAK